MTTATTSTIAAQHRKVADVIDAHPHLDLYIPVHIQVPTHSGDRETRVELVDELADLLDLGPADFAQMDDGTWTYRTASQGGNSPTTVYTCNAA